MQVFISTQTVSGKAAGSATATEDGGLAKNYSTLTEVITATGHIQDAYYFVQTSNAAKFIETLNVG